ncbi:recombinase family protein [Vibrio sp. F13]|uniref:recombinase family protein n=1 Tax=unclassified Vibrio TaxID=2614977 RepID=UPI0010BDE6A0|nr:recombinase family protein [Vibrio sp. F13]TKF86668.1 recombinase family protein [Vibrio sp. F13]
MKNGALLGLARVSTKEQDLGAQVSKLESYGCRKVWKAKHSGKSQEHQELINDLLEYAREGDTVVITKLDRLGRSLSQVLLNLETFKERGITVKCIEQGVDTGANDLMGKAMVHLLALFAEMERDMIEDRMQSGKAHSVAKRIEAGATKEEAEKAVKGGRPLKMGAETYKSIVQGLANGEPVAAMARKHGVTRSSIYNIKKSL